MTRQFEIGDHTLRIREVGPSWLVEVDGVLLDERHGSAADAWKSGVQHILWRRAPVRSPAPPLAGPAARGDAP